MRYISYVLVALFAVMANPARSWAGLESEPLVVDQRSHVAVMEYEAWFGPNGVTFQNSVAKPWLQSADMTAIGGGYDSADPAVIRQHVDWLEGMGIDAALVDLTNDVSCIFNTEWFVKKYLENFGSCPTLREDYRSIRDNTGNLYPAWARLHTGLKIIPLLGGIDENALYLDEDGKTAFEKEVEYFGALMAQYPQLNVIYESKPLMVIFLGAAQDPETDDNPLWYQLRQFLAAHPKIANKYTFRQMAGYIDSQPELWQDPTQALGPRRVSSDLGFWSWVDRLKTQCADAACPYYPSFNQTQDRVENLTVAVATAGQAGWGCPIPGQAPYCEDTALRLNKDGRYETLNSFMVFAQKKDPIFLFFHQFNEFTMPDEGFDANTDDDIEPSNLWGTRALDKVTEEVERYHRNDCRQTPIGPEYQELSCPPERLVDTPPL